MDKFKYSFEEMIEELVHKNRRKVLAGRQKCGIKEIDDEVMKRLNDGKEEKE